MEGGRADPEPRRSYAGAGPDEKKLSPHACDRSVADQQVAQLRELGDDPRVAAVVGQLGSAALLRVAVLLPAAAAGVLGGDLLVAGGRTVVLADLVVPTAASHGTRLGVGTPVDRRVRVRVEEDDHLQLEREQLGVLVVAIGPFSQHGVQDDGVGERGVLGGTGGDSCSGQGRCLSLVPSTFDSDGLGKILT
jgi:hypothetical protein